MPRYCRAAKWKMDNAKERIKGTIDWRREYKPDLIKPDEVKIVSMTLILVTFERLWLIWSYRDRKRRRGKCEAFRGLLGQAFCSVNCAHPDIRL